MALISYEVRLGVRATLDSRGAGTSMLVAKSAKRAQEAEGGSAGREERVAWVCARTASFRR